MKPPKEQATSKASSKKQKREFYYIAFNTYITPEQKQGLNLIANKRGSMLAPLVRTIFSEYLAKNI
jgi:hypothetical protein